MEALDLLEELETSLRALKSVEDILSNIPNDATVNADHLATLLMLITSRQGDLIADLFEKLG